MEELEKKMFLISNALNLAQVEIIAMYARTGLTGSNILDEVDIAYNESKAITRICQQEVLKGKIETLQKIKKKYMDWELDYNISMKISELEAQLQSLNK